MKLDYNIEGVEFMSRGHVGSYAEEVEELYGEGKGVGEVDPLDEIKMHDLASMTPNSMIHDLDNGEKDEV